MGVGVEVAVGTGVLVAVGTGVFVGTGVSVATGVDVGAFVGTGVFVAFAGASVGVTITGVTGLAQEQPEREALSIAIMSADMIVFFFIQKSFLRSKKLKFLASTFIPREGGRLSN